MQPTTIITEFWARNKERKSGAKSGAADYLWKNTPRKKLNGGKLHLLTQFFRSYILQIPANKAQHRQQQKHCE